MSISISGSGAITGATTSYSFDQSVSVGGTVTYEDVTNVDSIGIITARSGIEVTGGNIHIAGAGATIGVATAYIGSELTVGQNAYPSVGPLSNRNLIINGAMRVAQRGTSSVVAGNATVDRFQGNFNGGAVTQTQETLTTAAGDAAVYNLGFRYFFRQTNTTTSTGNSGHRNIRYRPEAQDISTSGWNYTSSASYVTLSFWVRSSVGQEFYGYIRSENGTERIWTFSTGTLVADEWTKIEKTIPGDSSIEIPNDNTSGLQMFIVNGFWGTTFTDASVTLDTWRNYDTALRTPHYTDTWAGTTNATLDITGVQFEVGSRVTPFEHESYGQTLAKCQRYFVKLDTRRVGSNTYYQLPTTMRATPQEDSQLGWSITPRGTDIYSINNGTAENGWISLNAEL